MFHAKNNTKVALVQVQFCCKSDNVTIFIPGLPVEQQALDEAAALSGAFKVGHDFLPADVRYECERIIPRVDDIKPQDAATAFLFLKQHYS